MAKLKTYFSIYAILHLDLEKLQTGTEGTRYCLPGTKQHLCAIAHVLYELCTSISIIALQCPVKEAAIKIHATDLQQHMHETYQAQRNEHAYASIRIHLHNLS